MRGFLITLEGGEGAGKTTQAQLLAEQFHQHCCPCLTTREPGGTALGSQLRQILLHGQQDPPTPLTELLLYVADRAEHVARIIRPALEQGQVVICDRYADSTVAYQGYGRGQDLNRIQALNQMAMQGTIPDLTLWLDLPVEIGLARAGQRRGQKADRMEAADLAFHQRLREGFQHLAAQDPGRIVRVEAQGTVSEVASQIWQVVGERLGYFGPRAISNRKNPISSFQPTASVQCQEDFLSRERSGLDEIQ